MKRVVHGGDDSCDQREKLRRGQRVGGQRGDVREECPFYFDTVKRSEVRTAALELHHVIPVPRILSSTSLVATQRRDSPPPQRLRLLT